MASFAPINLPVVLELNLTLNSNSDTGYTISVTVPAGQFSVCRIEIASQGINIPCMSNEQPSYLADSTGNINKVVWDLGRILNTGHRSTATDPQANVIQFKVIVVALNVSANLNIVNTGIPVTINADVVSTQGTTVSNTTSLILTNNASASAISVCTSLNTFVRVQNFL